MKRGRRNGKKKSPNYNEGQMSFKNLFNTMTVIAKNTLHAWKFLREWILTVITTKIIVQGYGYVNYFDLIITYIYISRGIMSYLIKTHCLL